MRSTLKNKKLGDYIHQVDIRNKNLEVQTLLGVSNEKYFMPSIANIVGTDLSSYKIVKYNQFAYGTVTSRNGDKISIALLKEKECIVSSSYIVFEINDINELNPDYLMMWFKRPEFDRYSRYMSHGSVRELFGWEKLCEVELPIPSIEEQLKIVDDYKVIEERIAIKEAINNNLFEQLSNLYRHNLLGNLPIDKLDSLILPEGYSIKTIGEYCSIKSGYAFKSDWWNPDDGFKVLKIGNISQNSIDVINCDFVSEKHLSKASLFKVSNYDMLIALTGATIGKIGFLPECDEILYVNQRVGKFFFDSPAIEKIPFIYCSLMQPEYINPIISKSEASSAQANMSGDDIQNLHIIYPPIEEINKFNKIAKNYFINIGRNVNEINKLRYMLGVLLSNITQQ